MDRVTVDRVIAGNVSAAGKLPAGNYFAEMEIGSRRLVEMVVGVAADRYKAAACLVRVDSHYIVCCLDPDWGIGFVEQDRSVPGLDTGT